MGLVTGFTFLPTFRTRGLSTGVVGRTSTVRSATPGNTTTIDVHFGLESDAWRQKQELERFFTFPADKGDQEVWKARGLLLAAAALYGTNFPMVKILGNTIPVGMGAALRFGLAGIVTSPWLLAPQSNEGTKDDEDTRWPSILAGMEVGSYNAVAYLAQAVGLETTVASKVGARCTGCDRFILFLIFLLSKSAFICSLSVIVVPVLDLMTGKKLTRDQLMGAMIAVIGVGLLELGGADGFSLSTGDLITFLQPLGFGMAFWRMEEAMRKYPHEAKRATAAQLIPVFLMSAVYCGLTETVDTSQVLSWLSDPTLLLSLFWTGVVTTALTLYMESVGLKTLSATETTLIFSTEPIWGALFASLLMGEQLGVGAAFGAALVVAGCILSNLGLPKELTALIGSFGVAVQGSAPATATAADFSDNVAVGEEIVFDDIIKSTVDTL